MKFRNQASFLEKHLLNPLLGGILTGGMNISKGVWQGLTATPFWRNQVTQNGTKQITSVMNSTSGALNKIGATLGYGAGRSARAVGATLTSTSSPVARGLWNLTANTPADALQWGAAAVEAGQRIFHGATHVTKNNITQKVMSKSGRTYYRTAAYRELKPWVSQGVLPAALLVGGGLGAIRGEMNTRAGYVAPDQMQNTIGTNRSPIDNAGADGKLAFALHNLRQGR